MQSQLCLPLGHRHFSQSRPCTTKPHSPSFVLQFVRFLYVISSLGGNCSPLTVLGLILTHLMVQSCPGPALGHSPERVGSTARVRGELLGWLDAAGHSKVWCSGCCRGHTSQPAKGSCPCSILSLAFLIPAARVYKSSCQQPWPWAALPRHQRVQVSGTEGPWPPCQLHQATYSTE